MLVGSHFQGECQGLHARQSLPKVAWPPLRMHLARSSGTNIDQR